MINHNFISKTNLHPELHLEGSPDILNFGYFDLNFFRFFFFIFLTTKFYLYMYVETVRVWVCSLEKETKGKHRTGTPWSAYFETEMIILSGYLK